MGIEDYIFLELPDVAHFYFLQKEINSLKK
jgi:hypothetical protein